MSLGNSEHDSVFATMNGPRTGHVIPQQQMSVRDHAIYQNLNMQPMNQMNPQGNTMPMNSLQLHQHQHQLQLHQQQQQQQSYNGEQIVAPDLRQQQLVQHHLHNIGVANGTTITQMQQQYPSPVTTVQHENNLIHRKSNLAKIVGTMQFTIGVVSIFIGILSLISAPKAAMSDLGGGIWLGVFAIVSGVSSVVAAFYPNRFDFRCTALSFCIITIILSICLTVMCFVFAGTSIAESSCTQVKSYCQFDPDYSDCIVNCKEMVIKGRGGGSYFSLLLGIMYFSTFVSSLINAIINGNGTCCSCCCEDLASSPSQNNPTGLMTAPIPNNVMPTTTVVPSNVDTKQHVVGIETETGVVPAA